MKGKTLLVNLWATWCVPCRKEMPALDTLEGKLGGPDFQVVAVNVDTARLDRPKAFLHDAGIEHLASFADPSGNVLQVLKGDGQLLGLPTTLLIDKGGCELGTHGRPGRMGLAGRRAAGHGCERLIGIDNGTEARERGIDLGQENLGRS